ncbi:MAG: tyrosine-type recombinase/integrase [Halobacteria archaeon]
MIESSDITVVTQPSKEMLNERQLVDYKHERKECLEWLLTKGKNPDRADGYAETTLESRTYRMDMFYRWVWSEIDRYTTDITHELADDWMYELAQQDKSMVHKSNSQKAVKMIFKWLQHEHGVEPWEPNINFYDKDSANNPRDYLTMEERRKIREAALDYGSVPSYHSLSKKGREKWRRYLSQCFGKSKDKISQQDWERANGWKIPSLVWTSMDTGLRPIEVARATVGWVDVNNSLLRIPKEDSSKNHDHWSVSIKDKTAKFLHRWLEQRKLYDKYNDSEKIWLTREGNTYGSRSLKYILSRLCNIASIPLESRNLSWYSIRHSVGTYMTREEDLAAAQAQLRHKSEKTTMKYDQTPPEDRRNALDKIG